MIISYNPTNKTIIGEILMDIGTALTYIAVIAIVLLIFFFWIRRKMFQGKKEKLKDLQDDFQEEVVQRETSEEDERTLEQISEKIENTYEKEEDSVEIYLDEGYDIEIETPDVFSLKTPRTTLFKSFKQIKFDGIEKTEEGVKLHLR